MFVKLNGNNEVIIVEYNELNANKTDHVKVINESALYNQNIFDSNGLPLFKVDGAISQGTIFQECSVIARTSAEITASTEYQDILVENRNCAIQSRLLSESKATIGVEVDMAEEICRLRRAITSIKDILLNSGNQVIIDLVNTELNNSTSALSEFGTYNTFVETIITEEKAK